MESKLLSRYGSHQLEPLFAPQTVAVIGATETPLSIGYSVYTNLLSGPPERRILPVHPSRPTILGSKAYPNIGAIGQPVDLAVIVTPAPTVPPIIQECVDAKTKAAVIISAGFKECGAAGAELERRIKESIRGGKMPLIGPNCLGIMSPHQGLNATFAHRLPRPGNVGFISQSGALGTAILDWSLEERVGFSAFVSVGSMLDVGWGDLIDYLGDDPHTKSILIYMESIGDARLFLSAAREVALSKPVIVMKAGRTEAAAKAAASHTGSLTGSDEVFDASCRRCGVLRVNSIAELFYMAEILSKQPRPHGPRLSIVTNAGGPAVLAADALIGDGGQVAPLSDALLERLNAALPPHWSHTNPIDVLGDADAELYAKAVQWAAEDPNADGVLAILAPMGRANPTEAAERLKGIADPRGKPILASWMGAQEVAAGRTILHEANIPTFPYPDTAARMFNHMWRYSYNLRGIYETPMPASEPLSTARVTAGTLLDSVRQSGRTLLTEVESKKVLAAYGIPVVETQVAFSPEEAVRTARGIGFPVVLKLLSDSISHKTDVGGVQLNLHGDQEVLEAYRQIQTSVSAKARAEDFKGVSVQPMLVRTGYEVIIGCSVDPQFGPVLLFGSGGQLVEVYRDRALALPPLNTTLARRMMEQTHIYEALRGVRGRQPVNLEQLEQLLVRFSELVVEQRRIREIDINPLLVSAEGAVALDARILLHPAAMPAEELPGLSIRPYPSQYVGTWTLKDGTSVVCRPIRPEDEPLLIDFHRGLSDRTVYYRYFHLLKLSHRVAHERLTRICFIDYDRELALVVERKNPVTSAADILAVGRLTRIHGTPDAEMAVIVRDDFQNRGIGAQLLNRLVEIARQEKLRRIVAEILDENVVMQRLASRAGFRLFRRSPEYAIQTELDL